MRLAHMAPIDGVAPVHEAGGDDQLVDVVSPHIAFEGARQLSAGMAAEHHRRTDVARVPARAGDVVGVIAEAVVVLAHCDDRRVAYGADGTVPCGTQSPHDGIQKDLDGVSALGGIGEVAQVQGTAELVRSQMVGRRHEGSPECVQGGEG
ncbi:hypothetical protein GCM10010467_26110 [Actinocorallia glomerata]|uniref:Uncharacterized protein n=2 Tax=Actinomycetes TaxID=1760 RepID=A0ABP6LP56_9MICC